MLIRSILFGNMPAGGASTARVARIDRDHDHTRPPRLVGDEGAQLPEGPGRQRCAVRLPSRYPSADMRQVLQRDTAPSALCLRNEPLTDDVVRVGAEAPFSAATVPQETAGALGPLDLQLPPQATMPRPQAIDDRATVDGAVAIYGEVDNA